MWKRKNGATICIISVNIDLLDPTADYMLLLHQPKYISEIRKQRKHFY